jgi:hypothetical protein
MNMSILSLPKDKNWDVSYEHDGAAFINDTYNVDLFSYPNKLISGPKVVPHTINSDIISGMTFATAFAYTNYNGNPAFVALCGQYLLKTASVNSLFAVATSEGAPSDLYDSDIAIHGMSSARYDIAVLSGYTNLSRFDYDVNTTQFTLNWWTGNMISILSITNATPVVVTTTTSHGYATGDQVVIRNTLVAALNGTWTITVISSTTFSLNGSTAQGNTSIGGYSSRIYNASSQQYESLGQPLLDHLAHPLIVFGNAPLLFVGDKNKVHSIAPPHTDTDGKITQPGPDDVQYSRLVFKKNYTIQWMRANSSTIFFGLSNDINNFAPGLVEVYDPFSEQVREYQIDEGSTMGFMYDNNLFIIDIKGNIRLFNGSSFEKKTAFPSIAYHGQYLTLPHRNGIVVNEGRVFMLLRSTGIVHAGVWCYEPSTNRLYHYASLTPTTSISTNAYGETYSDSYGALFFADPTTFLLGAHVTSNVSPATRVWGIFSNINKPSLQQNISLTDTVSRFTTGKIYSDTIDSAFKRLIIKYNPTPTFLGYAPMGKIVTWYRTSDDYRSRTNLTGMWTSLTTFTTSSTNAPSVGESIEVTSGFGSGVMGSVTSVSAPSNGVVTVTISESPLTTTPTGNFYYVKTNWKRLPITNDITSSSGSWAEIDIPENQATWIQFMIESRGFYAIESVQLGAQDGLRVEKN